MASRIYLVGNYEISEMLGRISRQRVYQITRRADFPRPVAKLAQGKVWLGEQVEAWIATRRGKRADRPSPPDTGADRPPAPFPVPPPSTDPLIDTGPQTAPNTGGHPGTMIGTPAGYSISGQARPGEESQCPSCGDGQDGHGLGEQPGTDAGS